MLFPHEERKLKSSWRKIRAFQRGSLSLKDLILWFEYIFKDTPWLWNSPTSGKYTPPTKEGIALVRCAESAILLDSDMRKVASKHRTREEDHLKYHFASLMRSRFAKEK